MGKPEHLPDKPSGRRFTFDENHVPSPVERPDPRLDPARIGIYAGDLPSAPKDHTPRTNDYPRGWSVQQPWYHPEFPIPANTRCILCGGRHPVGKCQVEKALVSLGASINP